MAIKIQNKAVQPWASGAEERDYHGFLVALRDLEVGQSFLWKPTSNDRMAITIVGVLFGRKFKTRSEGDTHRIGRVL